jgi:hypothetical protein
MISYYLKIAVTENSELTPESPRPWTCVTIGVVINKHRFSQVSKREEGAKPMPPTSPKPPTDTAPYRVDVDTRERFVINAIPTLHRINAT